MDSLADALGATPDAIETRLVELMHVTRDEAAVIRAAMIRRRLVVPAAGIALGAGVLAGSMKLVDDGGSRGASHQAPTAAASSGTPVGVSSATLARAAATVPTTEGVVTLAGSEPTSDAAGAPSTSAPAGAPSVATPPSADAPAPQEVVDPPGDDVVPPPVDEVAPPPVDEVVPPPVDDVEIPPVDDDVKTPVECPPELAEANEPQQLLSAQSLEATQPRLSTGTRINTALDDPANVRPDTDDCAAPDGQKADELQQADQDLQTILELLR
jgi:hypothetical protein